MPTIGFTASNSFSITTSAYISVGGRCWCVILRAIRLLLLVKKLSCHSCKFVGVNRLQNHFFWFQIEQELHIGGESQQVAITPNVIVSKLDEVLNAIFLRVFPDGRAFYVNNQGNLNYFHSFHSFHSFRLRMDFVRLDFKEVF